MALMFVGLSPAAHTPTRLFEYASTGRTGRACDRRRLGRTRGEQHAACPAFGLWLIYPV